MGLKNRILVLSNIISRQSYYRPVLKSSLLRTLLIALPALLCAACLPASRGGGSSLPSGGTALAIEQGDASYYGDQFVGRSTANGETYSHTEMTAAHRTFPFGTIARVINTRNGREAVVRINDRGPFKSSRIIDLSRRAAEDLDMIRDGITPVRVEVLRWGN